MKRMMILGAAGIVVLLIGSAASAQTSSPTRPGSATGTCVGPNFVDADGDGVCDHYQAGQGGQRVEERAAVDDSGGQPAGGQCLAHRLLANPNQCGEGCHRNE